MRDDTQAKGDIPRWSLEEICRRISASNRQSANGSQQYIKWENQAIRSDYAFLPCPCGQDCWCRRNGCTGHYVIKESMDFAQFLETYVLLWIPPKARDNVKMAVLHGRQYNGRQKNAVKPLQWCRQQWAIVLNEVRKHNKCGLCDSIWSVDETGSALGKASIWSELSEVNNLYQAKMWSQLFYDSLIPFDWRSKTMMTKAGYTSPTNDFLKMNRELFGDLRLLSDAHGLGVTGIRDLDSPFGDVPGLVKLSNGQPLSRVADKIFYSP